MIDRPALLRIFRRSGMGLAAVALALGCTRSPSPDPLGDPSSKATALSEGAPANGEGAEGERIVSKRRYEKPSDEALEKKLTPMQFRVTQHDATEPPFSNEYWDHHEAGLYVDVATGEPLFSSLDKFDSGTGWPSFTRPVEPNRVVERTDSTLGMKRVEVRSSGGGSHLGHVFDDGPAPRGLRYCINSASLRFIPVADLAASGYGEYASLFEKKDPATQGAGLETAVLAGGCFWGMEEILREIPGVVETQVGYAGGQTKSPAYEDVKTGSTGHAESVRIVFDPTKLAYAELLEKWFFRMHDPTTRDRQGNDVGSQYRSAIFVSSAEQRKIAEAIKRRVDESGKWDAPLVTQIVEAGPFTPAEDYHQDYLQKNPGGYTCHFMRD